jgi:class 3 adenylate cyclase/ribosomal protein L40E
MAVRCSTCGFNNSEATPSCGKCGSTLLRLCEHCGFENPPRTKFCGGCGAAFGVRRGSISLSDNEAWSLRGADAGVERRQLTVMFSDLVGSTALSEKLDPEELREVVQAYQEMAAAAVHRFEGTVARSLGDGLLIYFGLPIAHEDDAYRAVRTGLEIVATLPQLNARLQTTISVLRTSPLRVRVGIHTGMVVAEEKRGKGGRGLFGAVGETPVLATR